MRFHRNYVCLIIIINFVHVMFICVKTNLYKYKQLPAHKTFINLIPATNCHTNRVPVIHTQNTLCNIYRKNMYIYLFIDLLTVRNKQPFFRVCIHTLVCIHMYTCIHVYIGSRKCHCHI